MGKKDIIEDIAKEVLLEYTVSSLFLKKRKITKALYKSCIFAILKNQFRKISSDIKSPK